MAELIAEARGIGNIAAKGNSSFDLKQDNGMQYFQIVHRKGNSVYVNAVKENKD